MTKYRCFWHGEAVEIEADFAQASCPVKGTNGRQVADFRHRPTKAMEYVLKRIFTDESIPEEEWDDMLEDVMTTFETILPKVMFNVELHEGHGRDSLEGELVHFPGSNLAVWDGVHNYALVSVPYDEADDFASFLYRKDFVSDYERLD